MAIRTRLEEQLHRAEAKLRFTEKVAHCGSWEIELTHIADLGRCPTWWSDALYQIFGYEPGRFPPTHQRAIELIHLEDRSRFARAFSELVHQRVAYDLTFRIIRGDGRERLVRESANCSEGKSCLRLIGVVQDLTERSRTEQEHRQSEERFTRIFRASPVAIACSELGPRGFSDVNERWLELFGYERKEMIGWTDVDRGLWVDLQEREHLLARLASEGRVRDFESRMRHKSGEVRTVLLSVENLQFGREPMRLMIANDITERIENEKMMRIHSRLLESMAEGVHLIDEHGVILFSNPAAEVMFGYPAGGLVGKQVAALMDFDERESRAITEQIIRGAIGTGNWHGEIPNRKRDGTPFLSRARISPVKIGAKTCLVSVREDITENKRLEAQFLRAQRMESLGRLASGIAHDLNNILAPIMMAAPILQAGIPEDQREKLLATVESSAERGAHLVRQLLYFGRGVQGDRKSMRLKDTIGELVDMIRQTFPRTIAISVNAPNDTWPVLADGTQIHQVLLNLCVNARDAMADGGRLQIGLANVTTGAERDIPPGLSGDRYVRLTVLDTGTGIPVEQLNKIWDPFFTTKELGKGTGLGLSTALGIVKSHGGGIDVQTEVGRGTEFRIYLPADSGAPQLDERVAPPLPPLGQHETILLVEDEAAVRELTQAILQNHNYNVIVATDGREGLAKFTESADKIRLVVTDFDMPSMNGLSLVQSVRKIAPNMRVIVVSGVRSGLDSKESMARLRGLGIGDFLPKPFRPEEILNAVHEMLADATP